MSLPALATQVALIGHAVQDFRLGVCVIEQLCKVDQVSHFLFLL